MSKTPTEILGDQLLVHHRSDRFSPHLLKMRVLYLSAWRVHGRGASCAEGTSVSCDLRRSMEKADVLVGLSDVV